MDLNSIHFRFKYITVTLCVSCQRQMDQHFNIRSSISFIDSLVCIYLQNEDSNSWVVIRVDLYTVLVSVYVGGMQK